LESSFPGSRGASSLDRVERVMALEEVFDAEIPAADAEKVRSLRTVRDVLNRIQKYKKGGNSI
jgi:acyl carrier protein